MDFLASLEALTVSQWIQSSDWGYPIILCLHSIGMGLVVGIVLVISLRVLGFARAIPLAACEPLLTLAWGGFLVNAGSGVLLFMANATRLAANWTFQLKLGLIVAGGISVWALWRALERDRGVFEGGEPAGAALKAKAALTAFFWIAAITSGRYIAYVLDADLKASLQ